MNDTTASGIPPSGLRGTRTHIAAALVTAFFLAILMVRLPREVPNTDIDPSWGAVLNHAHAMGMQFGTQIAFTYGPLGFMGVQWFFDHAVKGKLFFSFALSYLVASGLCLVAWRTGMFWRCLLLSFVALVPATCHAALDLPVELGLFSWGLLCLLAPSSRTKYFIVPLVVLAVVSSLGKISFLVLSVVTIGAVTCSLLMNRQRRLALFLSCGFVWGWLVGWGLLGQSFFHIWTYLTNAMAVAAGYGQAMGVEARQLVWTCSLAAAVLTLGTAATFAVFGTTVQVRQSRSLVILAWVLLFLLLVWKHAFVRDNALLFASLLPVVLLALEAVPVHSPVTRLCFRSCAVGGTLLSLVLAQWTNAPHLNNCVSRGMIRFADNVSVLLRPGSFVSVMTQELDKERRRAYLPRIRRSIGGPLPTVDVFGQNQASAIFNGLNYQPRPVFQSYSAYTARLMHINSRYYDSPTAPDYVLFNLSPIDGRFPPLEDSHVLMNLLVNYVPVEAEGPFLLLRHYRAEEPTMSLLEQGTVGLGEQIALDKHGSTNIWMELSLRPTWKGKLRELFCKPADVYLEITGTNATTTSVFRAPTPMLAAGFLASPLQLNNSDVVDLYTTDRVSRPAAYSLKIDRGTRSFWNEQVHYKVYAVTSRLGRSAPSDMARLKFPGFQCAPSEIVRSLKDGCVTLVNERPAVLLRPGGHMVFTVPTGSTNITGAFGFTEAAYMGGETQGAEFRIEEALVDGRTQPLYVRFLDPRARTRDRGLVPFSVPLSTQSGGKVTFKAVSAPHGDPVEDLTCWADISFN